MHGKIVLITGASRGVDASVARRLAMEGARVVLTGRSLGKPSSIQLKGTLLSVAKGIHDMGGLAFVHSMDVTDANAIRETVDAVARQHGKIDMLINNASATDSQPSPTQKSVDRMHSTNDRATYACNVACLPHLKETRGQILTFSPPLPRSDKWIQCMPAYAMSKYGMTMATLAFAKEVKANTLWPRCTLRTSATRMLEKHTGVPYYSKGRHVAYFSEAVYNLLMRDISGRTLLDEEVLPHAPDDAPLDAFVDR